MSDDLVQFQEESSLHNYRTEIPNCIFEAKLDPYEFLVYCYIKRIAGDRGECFKSYNKMSEELGISRDRLIRALDTLCLVNIVLNSALLIKISRLKDDGSHDTNKFLIKDLWHINFQRHFEKYSGSTPERRGVVCQKDGGGLPKRPKEDPLKKIPLKEASIAKPIEASARAKEQHQTAMPAGEKIFYQKPNKQIGSITRSEIFSHFLKSNYPAEKIGEAITIMQTKKFISDPLPFLDAIILSLILPQTKQNKEKLDRESFEKIEYQKRKEENLKKPRGTINLCDLRPPRLR